MNPIEHPAIGELIALLASYNIRDVVLCPGSRNAPLIHALSHHLPEASCHSITDERSAGFYALGLAIATHRPVVVCCTSGTALLNLHPAVAEAYYQGIPLIIISADRPEMWIGQRAGQTLPQPSVFASLVRQSIHIPEPHTPEELWYTNRLLNEALLATRSPILGPIHINIPLADPSISLAPSPEGAGTTGRAIQEVNTLGFDVSALSPLLNRLPRFERKMILLGQESWALLEVAHPFPQSLRQQALCLGESLANQEVSICSLDALLASLTEEGKKALQPDLLITLGGHIVSNKMKQYLRHYPPREQWHLSLDRDVVDLFQCLTHLVTAPPYQALDAIATELQGEAPAPYALEWEQYISELPEPTSRYSSLQVVGKLMAQLPSRSLTLHLANSSAVRYAELFRKPPHLTTLCNRGTSGIEGSLSTALGYARRRPEQMHLLIIGDLSFFYDLNALGIPNIGHNVRVLLLNNQRGSIFQSLPTLQMDSISHRYITATHRLTAAGWAESCGWHYQAVHHEAELDEALPHLLAPASKPQLLESFVDADTEIAELRSYFEEIKNRK